MLFQIPAGYLEKSAIVRIKGLIMPLAGKTGTKFLRKLRYGNMAVMEMYMTEEAQVRHTVESHGGRVVDIVSDGAAGPAVNSLRYCTTKI